MRNFDFEVNLLKALSQYSLSIGNSLIFLDTTGNFGIIKDLNSNLTHLILYIMHYFARLASFVFFMSSAYAVGRKFTIISDYSFLRIYVSYLRRRIVNFIVNYYSFLIFHFLYLKFVLRNQEENEIYVKTCYSTLPYKLLFLQNWTFNKVI